MSIDFILNAFHLKGPRSNPKEQEKETKQNVIIWRNVILIILFHILTLISAILYWKEVKLKTMFWNIFIGIISGFGVTGGAHRLWSHKSYKANKALEIILLICFSISGQNTVYDWVRDHRVHHKFSETDADPHNAKRGFFFSHMGWLMVKKHPEVIKKGKLIDMSDITNNPLVKWHTRHFTILKLLFCFILPTFVPVLGWGQSFITSFLGNIVRYVICLNSTWLVNSAAHMWGNKPYDKRISPTQNRWVSFIALGEGWHNYHHVFPWDYKADEIPGYGLNITTLLIDLFWCIGWAYDLKQPSSDLVKKTAANHGDNH